jgi:hypothetical protein
MTSRRCVCRRVVGVSGRASWTPTRAMTARPTALISADVGSGRGSRGVGSSRRSGWGGIAGGWSGRCRGCRATGGCRSAGIGARGGGSRLCCWPVRSRACSDSDTEPERAPGHRWRTCAQGEEASTQALSLSSHNTCKVPRPLIRSPDHHSSPATPCRCAARGRPWPPPRLPSQGKALIQLRVVRQRVRGRRCQPRRPSGVDKNTS